MPDIKTNRAVMRQYAKKLRRKGKRTIESLLEQCLSQVVHNLGTRPLLGISWCRFTPQAETAKVIQVWRLFVAVSRHYEQKHGI